MRNEELIEIHKSIFFQKNKKVIYRKIADFMKKNCKEGTNFITREEARKLLGRRFVPKQLKNYFLADMHQCGFIRCGKKRKVFFDD